MRANNDHCAGYSGRRRFTRAALNVAVLVGSACVYAINTYCLKPSSDNWLIHRYLNDLFAMPFILAYSNLLIECVSRPDLSFVSPLRVAIFTAACSVVWECAAPLIKSSAVFVACDFVADALGASGYSLLFNTVSSPGRSGDASS